jgi:SAM-dependent methyltransferase
MRPTRLQHTDPTKRFSLRVEFYIRSRPHYPRDVLEFLRRKLGMRPEHVVADIGSGTGISSELFLANGNQVIGVEPNREMREAGEQLLKQRFPKFRSVDATAENTTLPNHSVDFIIVGQAFHWFDPDAARAEFMRIVKPGGWVVLMWNDRWIRESSFAAEYERIVDSFNTDVTHVHHSNVTKKDDAAAIREFFANDFRRVEFPNQQILDLEGVKDRLRSSSYMPMPDDPRYEQVMREAEAAYDRHAKNGTVTLEYKTEVFYGPLT